MPEKRKVDISVVVRVVRAAMDMSQEDFGKMLWSTRSAVKQWERGEAIPRKEKLAVIWGIFADLDNYVYSPWKEEEK